MPDRFRNARSTAWAAANRGGHEIDSFLEGPVFDRLGRLYVTDIPFGRIFRIDSDGEWELIAEYDGWPNGLKIHKDGRIFITCYKRGIMLLDPNTGAVTPFVETAGSEGFRGVNDLTFAGNGDLYFTDQGQTGLQDATGRVYRAVGRADMFDRHRAEPEWHRDRQCHDELVRGGDTRAANLAHSTRNERPRL
jgi:gluconolactonase